MTGPSARLAHYSKPGLLRRTVSLWPRSPAPRATLRFKRDFGPRLTGLSDRSSLFDESWSSSLRARSMRPRRKQSPSARTISRTREEISAGGLREPNPSRPQFARNHLRKCVSRITAQKF